MKTAESRSLNAYPLFKNAFGSEPEWVSAAPGRVNLIGEHTDYNLLPVLPMTIDRCIRIYGKTREDGIARLFNTSSDFPMMEINLDHHIEAVPGDWTNYVRAAMQAVAPVLRESGHSIRGFDAVIESDLPSAAGLSSSTALVVASCLALLHANKIQWPMTAVAERMRLAEHFVGTAGGGMDQAAISLGGEGSALLIEFDPLKATPVNVPPSISVYIINSGQKAEKTGAVRYAYNRRALECSIAVHLLRQEYSDRLGIMDWRTLRDVYCTCNEASLPWSELVTSCLPVDPLSLDGLLQVMERSTLEQLCTVHQLDLSSISDWLPGESFQVYARAVHVLSEAHRVYQFKKALQQDQTDEVFHLARASHASCRDLYHISTPELEQLIATARKCGASAARITGAGFGGCIVSFVPVDMAADFSSRLVASGIPAESIIKAISTGPARVSLL